MKVVAIWTQSVDGFIAKSSDDDLSWGSKMDKQWFSRVTKDIGVVVMGRKTAELIGHPLPGRLNVVMSRRNGKGPKQILQELKHKAQVAICGGASIYTAWFKEKLIDEVWLTVQPVVFGRGIKPVEDVAVKLELISREDIGEGIVAMRYKVIK